MTGEARVEYYLALLNPSVMQLVVFTAIVGLVVAPGTINPVIGIIAVLCIAIGAGGSGALNMWYDRDIDAIMSRTVYRPIPAGRVTGEERTDSTPSISAATSAALRSPVRHGKCRARTVTRSPSRIENQ